MSYENCNVRIWDVTYSLTDENGEDVLNEDGSIKMFRDLDGAVDYSTWADGVEPDDLAEVEEEPVSPCNAAKSASALIKHCEDAGLTPQLTAVSLAIALNAMCRDKQAALDLVDSTRDSEQSE